MLPGVSYNSSYSGSSSQFLILYGLGCVYALATAGYRFRQYLFQVLFQVLNQRYLI